MRDLELWGGQGAAGLVAVEIRVYQCLPAKTVDGLLVRKSAACRSGAECVAGALPTPVAIFKVSQGCSLRNEFRMVVPSTEKEPARRLPTQ